VFDATGTYRYLLWRSWDVTQPAIAFILLNPSTADGTTNDATIRRCLGFARRWGYGTVQIANLFAYRTPNPLKLRQVTDPVGRENDRYLNLVAQSSDYLVVGWGNGGQLFHRDEKVLKTWISAQVSPQRLYCLGYTQKGCPYHPLYVSYDAQLHPFLPSTAL
jgi:hypothetical protein